MNSTLNRLQTKYAALSTHLSTWLLMATFAVISSPAWAQAEQLSPPKSKDAPSSPKFVMMGIILLLLAVVVIVVTLKTKRGHQD